MTTIPLHVPDLNELSEAYRLCSIISQLGVSKALKLLTNDSKSSSVGPKVATDDPPSSEVSDSRTNEVEEARKKFLKDNEGSGFKLSNNMLYDAITKYCNCFECFAKVQSTVRIGWRLAIKQPSPYLSLHVSHAILGTAILCGSVSRRLYTLVRFPELGKLGYVFMKQHVSNSHFSFLPHTPEATISSYSTIKNPKNSKKYKKQKIITTKNKKDFKDKKQESETDKLDKISSGITSSDNSEILSQFSARDRARIYMNDRELAVKKEIAAMNIMAKGDTLSLPDIQELGSQVKQSYNRIDTAGNSILHTT
jgi:hypothetical protein